MFRTFGVVLTAATVALTGGLTAASAVEPAFVASPTASLTPFPCPPALPMGGRATGATTTSLTFSYWITLSPPCGYDPPITVSLFTSQEDSEQWRDPVAEGVSGRDRHGTITVEGLTPDTAYWFRFSDPEGNRDPYVFGGPARTLPQSACDATAVVDAGWSGGFVATVTVRNTGDEPLDGWRVSWRWSGDERVQSVWGGVVEVTGTDVTVRNAAYNGTVSVEGSTTFGLLAAASVPPDAVSVTCGR
ncbi:Cellulose binding domain-containing protein [Micromonospora nigra]|uniref:Cellulose binding domain-containing protein n=1 Tax=Micromonospora nigra TaxID=145857 RepID=A0A1C6R957_9ACTN|nr:cellulose binding domain-containing protein [Micromonospora nigra]SCL13485.1 Cellulose binding domain-containing protein [Micromonospora nigra]